MPLWKMPQFVAEFFSQLAALLDKRARPRLSVVFCGLLLCREKRRTVTAWFRAAGIGAEFRQAYYAIGSIGRRVQSLASAVLSSIDAAIQECPSGESRC